MALAKFHKKQSLTKIEEQVGAALVELQNTHPDLKTSLESIILTQAKEFQINKTNKKAKSAVLIYVHFQSYRVLLSAARKLIIELEKKLKQIVFFTAQRKIESKWVKEHKSQQRPRSRCLTYVYDALLDDLLLPSTLIGKRIRARLDGTSFYRMSIAKKKLSLTIQNLNSFIFNQNYDKLSRSKIRKLAQMCPLLIMCGVELRFSINKQTSKGLFVQQQSLFPHIISYYIEQLKVNFDLFQNRLIKLKAINLKGQTGVNEQYVEIRQNVLPQLSAQ